jgi:hypothetical protein
MGITRDFPTNISYFAQRQQKSEKSSAHAVRITVTPLLQLSFFIYEMYDTGGTKFTVQFRICTSYTLRTEKGLMFGTKIGCITVRMVFTFSHDYPHRYKTSYRLVA